MVSITADAEKFINDLLEKNQKVGSIKMVSITADAEKFINDLLEKNQKVGYGIKIYLSGFACSGPQFGMSRSASSSSSTTPTSGPA